VSGIPFGIDPEDLTRSKNIILWGTNTYLTNRHLWPVIEQAREAGATVTVIDPIRTSTADKADEFLQIRPGTDVALVLAMVHVMARDGLLDTEWINNHTIGWADLKESAAEMSPETAADITGIAADRIEALAHSYVTNRPSAIRVLVGPEHREHGRDIMRAVTLLPSLTGAWRDRGGGLARSTQVYFETALIYPDESDPPRRTFNMARLGQVLTDSSLAPRIEALVVHNSNPAVICPDQNAVLEGLARDDLFTVVIEQFMTDTARYADIILPATTQIEHLDLGIAWGHLYLSLNQPAIDPVGDALPNTEIFRRLANAMNLDSPGFQDSDETLVQQLLDSDHPWLEGITFESLSAQTWQRLNVDPGHRPYVDAPADTPDGRLHLGHLTYRRGTETPGGGDSGDYPLALISRKQHLKFLNANYGGFDKHLPSEREPRLEIHEADAQSRGVSSGDRVRVFNGRGTLTLTSEVSTDVQPGVTAIPFGWWHRHTPEQRGVNALTNPATPSDDLGSAAFHDTLVQVERVAPRADH
jgi:anaerobic selenocysteine-containing dehydrogenase